MSPWHNARILFTFLTLLSAQAKIHKLNLWNDGRKNIILSSFGHELHGLMQVKMDNFTFLPYTDSMEIYKEPRSKVGFTLSQGDEVPEHLRTTGECFLDRESKEMSRNRNGRNFNTVFFVMNFDAGQLRITRQGSLSQLQVCSYVRESTGECIQEAAKTPDLTSERMRRAAKKPTVAKQSTPADASSESPMIDDPIVSSLPEKSNSSRLSPANPDELERSKISEFSRLPLIDHLPLQVLRSDGDDDTEGSLFFSAKFAVQIERPEEEGPYYFIYHNCRNYDPQSRVPVDVKLEIVEKNVGSYLAAGDIPKPPLYFGLSALFFATGMVWLSLVRARKSKEVYKVHYLMTVLVFLKSCSLLFHGVNYHFISLYGHQQEVWAVVFYIMHLLKGALLFGTVILIGTGYTFFKNFLTERDRKLFMVVIPLQVLDNVAMIIIDETEEGQRNYKFWLQLFIFIDLLCCAAIILPVIWSIRHLQEGAETDGKAAFNLGKLRLFRHFYIMIICYIYLTRIIRYLVSFTVPFSYDWLVAVVEEVGTWVFFVVTGYKFQPAPNNPYLQLSQSDDELEMDEAVTQSGVLEGVTKLKRPESKESDEWDLYVSTDLLQSRNTQRGGNVTVGASGPDMELS